MNKGLQPLVQSISLFENPQLPRVFNSLYEVIALLTEIYKLFLPKSVLRQAQYKSLGRRDLMMSFYTLSEFGKEMGISLQNSKTAKEA
jgi:hypothetical protein